MRTIEAEQYFVCSLEVNKFTGTKGDKEMKSQLVDYDNKRVGATFHRIPTKYFTAIRKAEAMGREALADGNWLWTSKQPGESGRSSSLDGYLVHHEDFYELDKRMTTARNAFWSAVEENIIRMYDWHRRQGIYAYREATGNEMSESQIERFYPHVSEVKKSFDFRFKPLPLYGVQSDTDSPSRWHPSWSNEKRDLFERVQQAAIEDQSRRVQSGMENLVGRVLEVARKQAENISQYKNSDDGPNGSLPYANTWSAMQDLADELSKWSGRVQNDNGRMRGLAADIYNMMSGINAATAGNISDLRGMMSHEHAPIRDKVGSQLKDIERSASSALEDLLS